MGACTAEGNSEDCRSPPSLWVPWHSKIFSAGAYILHRPAMRKLLDALLPGKLLFLLRLFVLL